MINLTKSYCNCWEGEPNSYCKNMIEKGKGIFKEIHLCCRKANHIGKHRSCANPPHIKENHNLTEWEKGIYRKSKFITITKFSIQN